MIGKMTNRKDDGVPIIRIGLLIQLILQFLVITLVILPTIIILGVLIRGENPELIVGMLFLWISMYFLMKNLCILNLYENRLKMWGLLRMLVVDYRDIVKCEFVQRRFGVLTITYIKNGKSRTRTSSINISGKELSVLEQILKGHGLVDELPKGKTLGFAFRMIRR